MARHRLLDLEQQFTFYVSYRRRLSGLETGDTRLPPRFGYSPLPSHSTALYRRRSDEQRAHTPPQTHDPGTDGSFALLRQASYHTNQVNVLIHIFCVPTILFTALILTHGIPGASKSLATIPFDLFGQHYDVDLTFPFLWAAGNAAYFVLLEPVAGVRHLLLPNFGAYNTD